MSEDASRSSFFSFLFLCYSPFTLLPSLSLSAHFPSHSIPPTPLSPQVCNWCLQHQHRGYLDHPRRYAIIYTPYPSPLSHTHSLNTPLDTLFSHVHSTNHSIKPPSLSSLTPPLTPPLTFPVTPLPLSLPLPPPLDTGTAGSSGDNGAASHPLPFTPSPHLLTPIPSTLHYPHTHTHTLAPSPTPTRHRHCWLLW